MTRKLVLTCLVVLALALPTLAQARACIAVLGGDWDDCRPRASASGEPREWCGGNGAGNSGQGLLPADVKAAVDAYIAKVVAVASKVVAID